MVSINHLMLANIRSCCVLSFSLLLLRERKRMYTFSKCFDVAWVELRAKSKGSCVTVVLCFESLQKEEGETSCPVLKTWKNSLKMKNQKKITKVWLLLKNLLHFCTVPQELNSYVEHWLLNNCWAEIILIWIQPRKGIRLAVNVVRWIVNRRFLIATGRFF